MTLHSEKRHRIALNKIKKLNAELQERKEYAADEIKRLTAQCDSLSTAVHVHKQELAETRTELVSLDSQLATARELGGKLTAERNQLETLVESLKKTFISNVTRLEAALKESEDAHERHYQAYTKLETDYVTLKQKGAEAFIQVDELKKTLSLLPGCDNPRSPQDVMDVLSRLSRLEEMEESSTYEAGRNSALQERDALNYSVQAYSKRVARLDEELKKLGKEHCALQEEHIKTVDDLYRAKNYAAGPSWDEHRETLAALVEWKARVKTTLLGSGRIANPGLLYWLESQDEDFKQDVRRNFIQPGLKALRSTLLPTAEELRLDKVPTKEEQINRLRKSMYELTGKEFDEAAALLSALIQEAKP